VLFTKAGDNVMYLTVTQAQVSHHNGRFNIKAVKN